MIMIAVFVIVIVVNFWILLYIIQKHTLVSITVYKYIQNVPMIIISIIIYFLECYIGFVIIAQP